MASTKNTQEKPAPDQNMHRNMRFYGLVQSTPAEARKEIGAGRLKGYTDINPMWRIKKLTEVFGPAGIGWWTQNEVYELKESPETKEVACFCTLQLVYVDPETQEISHPITGIGGNKFIAMERNGPYCNDEAYKMAYTDALSIACKSLGFSHDIYFQKDRTKYCLPEDEKAAELQAKLEPKKPAESKSTASSDEVKKAQNAVKELVGKILEKSPERKQEIAGIIKAKLSFANYLKCEDAQKLNELLSELKAA